MTPLLRCTPSWPLGKEENQNYLVVQMTADSCSRNLGLDPSFWPKTQRGRRREEEKRDARISLTGSCSQVGVAEKESPPNRKRGPTADLRIEAQPRSSKRKEKEKKTQEMENCRLR